MILGDLDTEVVWEQEVCPNACRALWLALIEEQRRLAFDARVADHPMEIHRAREWFGSRDYHTICALAGLDGDWIMMGIAPQIAALKDAA